MIDGYQPDIEKEEEKDLEKLGRFQAILSTVCASAIKTNWIFLESLVALFSSSSNHKDIINVLYCPLLIPKMEK